MNVAGLVAEARAVAQSLMIDTVTIARVTQGAVNTTTGAITTTSTTIYSGKCRLRGGSAAAAQARESDVGEAEQIANRYALLLPYGSDTSVLVGDIATIGSRTFTVVGRIKTTTVTAASLLVEESPEP